MRAQENVASSQETLQSIAKLVDEIPNMPVRQDVVGDVMGALIELDQVCSYSLLSFPYLCAPIGPKDHSD